jgi:hypothetical protein
LPVIMEEGQEQLTPADEAATEASCSQSTKPRLPENFNSLLVRPRLKTVKQFIGSFHYRHTAHTNFNAQKLRPLARIMDTARMIVYAPQPIKCVEAVFLALYLTAGLPEVERIPLGFKTEIGGQVVLFKLLIELLLLWYQVSDQNSQVNMLKRGWATMRELVSGPASC